MFKLGVRRRVPKKQGLKPEFYKEYVAACKVRRRVPKKQGLKQLLELIQQNPGQCPKASSKKTRIETDPCTFSTPIDRRPKASSKKTRIETQELQDGYLFLDVRRRVPKKQGLKPGRDGDDGSNGLSPKASSKKTRIETWARW